MQNNATSTNSSSPKHILIVDDDGDVREVVTAMLQEHGYRVSAALGGASMRAFLKGDDPVDAIVLDALMPGESGKDLALHAKELRLPVVMISGSPEPVEFAAENGLQLLPKPFRMQQLFEALDEAIGSGEFGQRRTYAPPVPRGPSDHQSKPPRRGDDLMDAIEKNTIPFLRMAAMEMRRIANDAPDIAERLHVMASKLDAEADDLSRIVQSVGLTELPAATQEISWSS